MAAATRIGTATASALLSAIPMNSLCISIRRAVDWPLIFGLALYLAAGITQIAAFLAGLESWAGLGTFWGALIFFGAMWLPFGELCLFPLTFFGAYGVWGWPWWEALFLTFPFLVVGLGVTVFSVGADFVVHRFKTPSISPSPEDTTASDLQRVRETFAARDRAWPSYVAEFNGDLADAIDHFAASSLVAISRTFPELADKAGPILIYRRVLEGILSSGTHSRAEIEAAFRRLKVRN